MIDNVVNLSYITVGLVGFFVTLVMCFTFRSNLLINPFLLVFFLIVSIRLLKLGVFGTGSADTIPLAYDWSKFLLLIGVPSIYLYFKSLYLDYASFEMKFSLHFIFPIVITLGAFAQTYFGLSNNFIANTFKYMATLALVLYYFTSISLFLYPRLWRQNELPVISQKHEALIRQWVMYFYLLIVLLFIRLLFLIYANFTNEQFETNSALSILGNTLWLIAFVKILVSPEILYGYPFLEKRISEYASEGNNQKIDDSIWTLQTASITNLQDQKLNDVLNTRVNTYLSDIEKYTVSENPFRRPSYTLGDMARALNFPASHLSYIFKYHSSIGFTEYKKYARINDSLRLIQLSYLETHTLEALAIKVGFSSYNSFFVAFKKYTGQAPKEFILKK